MLYLHFNVDSRHYGVEVGQIIEVIPWVTLRAIPLAPDYVRGCFKYRGRLVPVLDMTSIIEKRAAKKFFSSRITIVKYKEKHLLGLLMEGATETIQRESESFQDSGVKVEGSPFLGGISAEDKEFVQFVKIEELLSESVREIIFSDTGGEGQ